MIRFRRIVCLLMLLMTMSAGAQVLDVQESQGFGALAQKGVKMEDWGDKQVKLSRNDSIDGNKGIEAQSQYPILSQKSKRHSIGLKFMGLSFHPLSGKPNAELMPNRLDEQAYFVLDFGALLTYEYFIVPDVLSVKFIQGLYADCAAQIAGVTSIGLRARIFQIGRHSLFGGIGPTWIYRHNWYRIPNYVDTEYYKGTPTDKWQYKFLWYGGELEYKFAISSKLDFATIFVPGYPHLMAFAVGVNYKL